VVEDNATEKETSLPPPEKIIESIQMDIESEKTKKIRNDDD
jgi:hypothetical protein